MLTAAIAMVTLAHPSAPAMGRRISNPTNIQIYEVFSNPPGGSDDAQGLEYVELIGPVPDQNWNGSLDGYALVAIENEHSGNGADDRGTVDMIVPLDGLTLDANGLCIIRDFKTNGTLGTFSPADPFAAANEKKFQWQSTFTTAVGYTYSGHTKGAGGQNLHWGGNTLENEGTNLAIVKYVNKNLTQEIDGVSKGTNLDIDKDGVLDYTQASPPTGWIQPWESVSDAVFIPVKDKALGTSPAGSTQIDYTGSMSATTRISCERHPAIPMVDDGMTPDWFARFSDTNALVSDILASGGNVYNVDSAEVFFALSSTYGTVVANSPATLGAIQIKLGLLNYFSVQDSVVPPNTWSH